MENEKKSIEFFRYLEKIRASRNISQEIFTDDIVSMRQYRRYLNGESTVSHDALISLCNRIGLKLEYALLDFESDKLKETQEINHLYNSVVNYDFSDAKEQLKKINRNSLIDNSNRLLFDHISNLILLFNKKNTIEQTFEKTKKLINLETTIENTTFTNTELLILISLFQFDNCKNLDLIAIKLKGYINNEIKIISGHNIKTVVLVLQQLSKYYGSNSHFSEVIACCDTAIKYSNKMFSFYLLEYLYFYKALAYYELQNQSNLEDSLYHCYVALEISNNNQKKRKIANLIKDYIKIDLDKFIKAYYINNS
ncbi:conserved hypothetical protein [Alteracholeplasma palmae J233]|uniref:HTH cro/C1-type domain-containing protein n=1 Tax=Alteracholeplasma palmae (strain ATCC 49389 / J233) TaxID=1318466 RepID=U4KM24_ALTPJ|nr:helix-turn-helix transcriptional regulator [Alteracholeplasma palmae]CCV65008.1 conserved hypothetical protein [Alteracholeplasma palmae J233]